MKKRAGYSPVPKNGSMDPHYKESRTPMVGQESKLQEIESLMTITQER